MFGLGEVEFTQLIVQYGDIGLFILLALGIFGLPIPDETLLVVAGFLVAQGKLSPIMTFVVGFSGGAFGITLSYLVGFYAGKNTLYRYGKWIGFTHEKVTKAHNWFEKIGKWLLLIGFYIPGVRHLTGFIAGTVYLSYWEFALFAYVGAFIWSASFIIIGFFFYDVWMQIHHFILE